MAEFCKQCADNMGWPHDFERLSTFGDTMAGLYPVVLCEGCGPIQVDHTGKCVSVDCIEKHNK